MTSPTHLPQPSGSAKVSDEDVCRYIAEMCADLQRMAQRPRLRMIGYLLDMVRLEAEKTAADSRERS